MLYRHVCLFCFITFFITQGIIMLMNESLKDALASVIIDVMNNHESSFEAIQDYFGIESIEANQHIYNLARNLWTEFEIDLMNV